MAIGHRARKAFAQYFSLVRSSAPRLANTLADAPEVMQPLTIINIRTHVIITLTICDPEALYHPNLKIESLRYNAIDERSRPASFLDGGFRPSEQFRAQRRTTAGNPDRATTSTKSALLSWAGKDIATLSASDKSRSRHNETLDERRT